MPDERGGGDEVAAVADEVPKAGEAAHALQRGEVDGLGLQNFVRGIFVVNHLPIGVVADDGCAAEAFEDADLDFLRAQGEEPVEAEAEAFHGFAGEADD